MNELNRVSSNSFDSRSRCCPEKKKTKVKKKNSDLFYCGTKFTLQYRSFSLAFQKDERKFQ